MFKYSRISINIILCYFILLGTTHAQVATVNGREISIPLPNCGQALLISKADVPPQLKSLLNSLGYYTTFKRAYFESYGLRVPSYFGTSAADVWSKLPYSRNPTLGYQKTPVAS